MVHQLSHCVGVSTVLSGAAKHVNSRLFDWSVNDVLVCQATTGRQAMTGLSFNGYSSFFVRFRAPRCYLNL